MRVFAAAAQAIRTGRRAALATVTDVGGSTPRSSSARMLVYEDGEIVGTIGGGAVEHQVIAAAIECIRVGRPTKWSAHLTRDLGMCCGGRMEVYLEPLMPREPFVMFGAGHVAHALAPMLDALDFDVIVVDGRDELNTAERFPKAQRVLEDGRGYAASLPDDDDAYRLVVTHDHALDQDLVEAMLSKRCAWLGMIGSRGKVARFLVRYLAAGVDQSLFQNLSAPVGLDLGAETPAEIAVAIAAEVVAVRRRSVAPAIAMSKHPLEARGGDGTATPPRLRES
ncbi:MAG: xanthine dehydrogenase accessory protein XdhC [Deltaproteobacteria bacterium]|nr:MAG: xanthine dehydrogenase accessory protein XdhC [Deltaproteobacteria bacterium]